jgi:methylenetetrahydrofolate reductase (NADPH)
LSLRGKLGKEFVITTELRATDGVDIKTSVDQARRYLPLDGLNIHDCPGGRLRMNSIAQAHIIQSETGQEMIPHLTCRDRSLLGIQADLLGANALGIRNILIATGDAPKRGTYPSRAVFDLNSIELIGLIKKMNNGLDYNDKPFQGQTRLCISATARPGARDLEADIERTRQKAAAGADFIQTQPIFHADKARLFMNAVKDLKIPVIMGIMPLRNLRTAELMDKSVPGITIPPEFMEAIATSEQAMIDATCRLITEIYPLVGGIHVMAMGDIEVSNILIEHIRSLGKPDTVSFLS